MHMMIEQFEHAGMVVRIHQDEDTPPPSELDDDSVFIVTTRNRHFVVLHNEQDANTLSQDKDFMSQHHTFKLRAYIHSGVALSLGTSYPFNCPWDSGWIGLVCVAKHAGITNPEESAEAKVEEWNQYLSGDVYWVEVLDDGVAVDSCCGFYGIDFAREQGREMAESAAKAKAQTDRMERDAYAI